MTDNVEKLVIIGSGPAGLTAAIYASRASLEPRVLEGEPSSTSDQPGGQLMLTTDVENFPGFPEGVMGPELMMSFKKQAERFGSEIHTVKASKVDLSERPFKIWVGDPDTPEPTHIAKTVIVSTGAQSLMLGLDRETDLIGHGLSTCATCDGFFFRDQEIAVVGGGDSALEEASFLSRFASKVYIVVRRDELRASKIMQQRALDNPKIEFAWNSVLEEVLSDEFVTGVRVRDVNDDSTREIPVEACFIAIGHQPNTELLVGQIELDPTGYIKVEPGGTRTSAEGVFACGDAMDPTYRQAVTAAGTGCMAAIDAERWMAEQGIA